MENSLWSQYLPGEDDNAFKEKTRTPRVPRVDSDIFTCGIYPKWDAEMRVTDFFFNDVIYFYFSSSPKNPRQCLAVTSLWMIST